MSEEQLISQLLKEYKLSVDLGGTDGGLERAGTFSYFLGANTAGKIGQNLSCVGIVNHRNKILIKVYKSHVFSRILSVTISW